MALATDKPYLVVNGEEIPQARFDEILKQVTRQQADSPELRKRIREALVSQMVLVQQAKKDKLDQQVEVKIRIEVAQQNAMQQVLIQSFIEAYQKKNPVTDKAVREEYNKIKADYDKKNKETSKSGGGLEYKARHILLKTEEEATQVLADLKKGKAFDQLVKEQSIDPGNKDRGGDLGWASASTYVPEFATALSKMKKGETSKAPVKTQFGYHIIRLEDTRKAQGPEPQKFPSLDEIKNDLKQQLEGKQVEEYVKQQVEKAKVEG